MPGRLTDAMAQYKEALRLNPDYAEAHNNLANALARTPGRLPEAVAQYEEALSIDPGYVAAHYNIASAYARMGRLQDAIFHLEKALKLDPGSHGRLSSSEGASGGNPIG